MIQPDSTAREHLKTKEVDGYAGLWHLIRDATKDVADLARDELERRGLDREPPTNWETPKVTSP